MLCLSTYIVCLLYVVKHQGSFSSLLGFVHQYACICDNFIRGRAPEYISTMKKKAINLNLRNLSRMCCDVCQCIFYCVIYVDKHQGSFSCKLCILILFNCTCICKIISCVDANLKTFPEKESNQLESVYV